MKYSEFFIPTVKDIPSDAEIISHKLMIKAGMIKQSSAGIYSWLPLGFKVLKNFVTFVSFFLLVRDLKNILSGFLRNML